MKFYFPDYQNYMPKWHIDGQQFDYREVNDTDYFKCIDDFIKYFNEQFKYTKTLQIPKAKLNLIKELKCDILNAEKINRIPEFIKKDRENNRKDIISILNQYPIGEIRDKYKVNTDELFKLEVMNKQKSGTYIIKNKEEVFSFFDTIIVDIKNILKEKQKISHKKHYEKMKDLLEIKPRVLLTEEEKAQRIKENNFKNRQKQKELKKVINENTDEIINENTDEIIKQKVVKEPRVLLTAEEKRERKKLANKKYYQSNIDIVL